MKKIIKINLLRILKNPWLIVIWLSFPFVIIALYYLAFGLKDEEKGLPKVGLLILDNDKSIASQFFYQAFQREPLNNYFKTEQAEDENKIIKLFQRNLASAAIIIPKNFQSDLLQGEKVYLKIIKNPIHHLGPLIAEESIKMLVELSNYFIANIRKPLQMIKKLQSENVPPAENDIADISRNFYKSAKKMINLSYLKNIQANLSIEGKEKAKTSSSTASFYFSLFLPGVLFFSLMFLSIEFQHILFRDNIQGLTNRLLLAPLSRSQILIGQFLFIYIAACLYALLAFLIAKAFLKIKYMSFLNLSLTVLGFCLFSSALAQLIFNIPKSEKTATGVASGIVVIINLIGGAFFPINFFPENLQRIVKYTPIGMTNTAVIDSLIKGSPFSLISPYILGIWIWGLFLLIASYIIQKKRSD